MQNATRNRRKPHIDNCPDTSLLQRRQHGVVLWLLASFTLDGDTRGLASNFARYSCDLSKPEGGGDVVATWDVPEESDLDVLLEGDGSGVDVDVHILRSLAQGSDGTALDCLARADKNVTLFAQPPGRYYVVVDTYGTSPKPGRFRLFARAYPTATVTWTEIGSGVRWGRGRYDGSTLNVLELGAGARLEVVDFGRCVPLSAAVLPAGAVAAVNAGFFKDCAPAGFLKVGNDVRHTALGYETVLGVSSSGALAISRPPAGSEWSDVDSGVGGRGRFDVQAGTYSTDNAQTSFHAGRHPRTLLGRLPDADVLMTIDGRTQAGQGLTFAGISGLLDEWGATDGINFDGGGSTTMWIRSEPLNGIVSYPSDSGEPNHFGSRSVRSALAVIAAPTAPLPPSEPVMPPVPSTGGTGSSEPPEQPQTMTQSDERSDTTSGPAEPSDAARPVSRRPQGCHNVGAAGWWSVLLFILYVRPQSRASRFHDGNGNDDRSRTPA